MTSPLVRAVQTAEIVAVTTELGKRQGQVEVRREFGLGASDAEVIVKRARDEGRKRLMVVGHEPDLTRLVSILQQAPFSRPFDKSMVVSLHLKSSGAPATVRFVLDPKSLDFEWEP